MAFAVTLGRGVPNAINIGALTALGYSFTAWITVDGASCPIYGLRNSSSVRDATCWIPSDEGKKFSVNWNTRSRDRPLYAQLWIDGVFCATSWMLDARNFPHEHQPMGQSFSFATTSDYTRRDFVFSSIQVTDDDEYLHTLDSPPAFGTIRLELWEGDIQQVVQAPFRHSYGSEPVLDDKIIHERSKKAGVHHVKSVVSFLFYPTNQRNLHTAQVRGGVRCPTADNACGDRHSQGRRPARDLYL